MNIKPNFGQFYRSNNQFVHQMVQVCSLTLPGVGKALSTLNNPVSMDENRENTAPFCSVEVALII